MPKAVDRLLGVTYGEQISRPPAPIRLPRDRLDQRELHAVRVLQLVDHDPLEAVRVALAQLVVLREQIARHQLEILEVESGHGSLERRVPTTEPSQQLRQQRV